MAPRTADEVEKTLEAALFWRRAELAALKGAISGQERDHPGAALTVALARSGVTMLYTHWEGFVKEAWMGRRHDVSCVGTACT